MAYTLKASGIATNLVMCVAVDEDGTTIREFVSSTVNTNMTLGTGVAASVATGSWKGTARNYWASTDNGGYDYHGVKFPSGNRPTLATNNGNGFTLWEAYHAVNTANNLGGLISYSSAGDGGASGTRRSTSGTTQKLELYLSSGARGVSTTTIPVDNATKYSTGVTFNNTVTGAAFFYGLESGSLAADGTSTSGVGFASATGEVYGVGGYAGQGSHPAARYCSLLFNRELTLSEMQSLHDDWFGTLFDSADVTAPVLSSAVGTATGSSTATVGATTDEGNGTLYAFVSTSATPPSDDADLKAGTGAVWAGSVAVSSTGAKTLNATGLTASTGYYAHLLHTDAAANDSNTVTSAQFTTLQPETPARAVFVSQAAGRASNF